VITGLTISILTIGHVQNDVFSAFSQYVILSKAKNLSGILKPIKILLTIFIVFYITFSIRIFVSDRYYKQSLEKKELAEKIAGVEKARKWNPENPEYSHSLALLYQEQAAAESIKPYAKYKLLFSAKRELETAIRQSPLQIKYLASYGWLLGNLGMNDEARKVLDTAVNLNPDLKPATKLKKDFEKLKG
jgi:tetratricopeptide (TPR) repeat protein